MVGLAITWTKSKMMESWLDEVQNIVLAIVTKIIIPDSAVLYRVHLLRSGV